MTVRLRRAPPRRRGAMRPGTTLAAVVVALAAAWFTLGDQGEDGRRVRIELLRPSAAEAPPAATLMVDGALISLPPLAPPRPFLTDHRVVSFYGNPLAGVLGVLGEQGPEQTVARLRAQAEAYVALSDDRTVVPAMHLIYAVAQEQPGEDGSHLARMDSSMVERYIRLTRDSGMLLFLDIQMGRSTVEAELPRIFRYLEHEHVHVALDPEFAWGRDGKPGEDIGYLEAEQINRAQQILQQFTIERRLSTKILVVHQFLPGMVRNKASLRAYDRVELVIDADGFGPRHVKLGSWERVIREDNVQLAGIKLFYRHDINLMAPADVLALEPRPVIIIYQ